MAWFVRYTRFLDAHLVYAQEASQSCGIACVMMTVFKVNKLRPGAAAVHTEEHIDEVYGKVTKTHYNGTSVSYANHLASTLNHLKVGRWKAEYVGPSQVAQTVLNSVGVVTPGPVVTYSRHHKPVIILVGWKSGTAHFVVIDTVVSWEGHLYASVCDPWDGDVHIRKLEAGHAFHYVAKKGPFSWDLGGERHNYSTPNDGSGNGWVIRHV